jgi:hypothetical protein
VKLVSYIHTSFVPALENHVFATHASDRHKNPWVESSPVQQHLRACIVARNPDLHKAEIVTLSLYSDATLCGTFNGGHSAYPINVHLCQTRGKACQFSVGDIAKTGQYEPDKPSKDVIRQATALVRMLNTFCSTL